MVNALKKVIMHYHDSRGRCHDDCNVQLDGEVVLVLMIVMSSCDTGSDYCYNNHDSVRVGCSDACNAVMMVPVAW